MVVRQAER